MNTGIGLPSMLPGTDGATVVRWAEAAEAAGFTSLTTTDRIAYGNQEPLMALSAAAAVTQHVKLMPTVLLVAVRQPVLLAKQLASLDVISNGRVVLGAGVGGREDDFAIAGMPFRSRARRFEESIELMRRVWNGEPVGEAGVTVGPKPVQRGGPPILIGAIADQAIARVGKFADGFIRTGGPEGAEKSLEIVRKSWEENGRKGKPKLVTNLYFALGEEAAPKGRAYMMDYYSFAGPAAERIASGLLTTVDEVANAMQGLQKLGFDEVNFWPTVADLRQVRLLAEAVEAAL